MLIMLIQPAHAPLHAHTGRVCVARPQSRGWLHGLLLSTQLRGRIHEEQGSNGGHDSQEPGGQGGAHAGEQA